MFSLVTEEIKQSSTFESSNILFQSGTVEKKRLISEVKGRCLTNRRGADFFYFRRK